MAAAQGSAVIGAVKFSARCASRDGLGPEFGVAGNAEVMVIGQRSAKADGRANTKASARDEKRPFVKAGAQTVERWRRLQNSRPFNRVQRRDSMLRIFLLQRNSLSGYRFLLSGSMSRHDRGPRLATRILFLVFASENTLGSLAFKSANGSAKMAAEN